MSRRYLNIFKHINNIDDTCNMITRNVYEITKLNYKTPNDLIKFNNDKYRNLYKFWGKHSIARTV